jgi:hypothetical protein
VEFRRKKTQKSTQKNPILGFKNETKFVGKNKSLVVNP